MPHWHLTAALTLSVTAAPRPQLSLSLGLHSITDFARALSLFSLHPISYNLKFAFQCLSPTGHWSASLTFSLHKWYLTHWVLPASSYSWLTLTLSFAKRPLLATISFMRPAFKTTFTYVPRLRMLLASWLVRIDWTFEYTTKAVFGHLAFCGYK